MIAQDVRAKFVASIEELTGEETCWLWQGKNKNLFIYERGSRKKHHARDVAYFIVHAERPKVAFLMKCLNPLCVNPAHFIHRERRRGRPSLDAKTRKERKAQRQRAWRAKQKAAIKEELTTTPTVPTEGES